MLRITTSPVAMAVALFAPFAASAETPEAPAPAAPQTEQEALVNSVDSIITVEGRIDPSAIAGSATLVDTQELRLFDYSDPNRVLRQVPGVNLQEEDGFGLFPNIGLRGTPVERSGNITLMEDGVLIAPAPYAAPAAYYFPAIGRMEAVEVIKGAASVRYGPRTIGGAINLRSTSIPEDGITARAMGQYGSRDYYAGHVYAGIDTDYVGALVETYQLGSDGFKTIDFFPDADTGFQRQDYRGKVALHTAPGASVDGRLEFTYGYSELDANETYLGLSDDDFAADPYRRYAASQRDNFLGKQNQYRLTGTLAFVDDTLLTVTAYRNDFERNWSKLQDIDFNGDGRFDSINAVFDDPAGNPGALAILRGADSAPGAVRVRNNNRTYDSKGVQVSFSRPFQTGKLRHVLDFSVRYHEDEEDRLQNDEFYTQTGGTLNFVTQTAPGVQANREAKANALAFYVEDRIEIGALTLTPGIRYEGIDLTRLDYAGSDPTRAAGPTRVRTKNVDEWLPALGATYEIGDLLLLAGISRGFSPPGPGSTDARAEKSWNYEAGFRYANPSFRTEVIGFWNDYSNLLGSCTVSVGCRVGDIGDQFNGGAVTTRGVEFTAAAAPAITERLSAPISVTYTFTDARFDRGFDSEFFGSVQDGDDLPYIARHRAYVEAGLRYDRSSLTLGASYVSPMRTEAGSGPIPQQERIDDHFLLDLAGRLAFTDTISLFGRVDNLLDNQYPVARRPYGLRPGSPRRFVIGASFDL